MNIMGIRDKYAFVGVGLTKMGRLPGISGHELAVQAALLAMEDAGLKKSEINGYICQQTEGSGNSPEVVRDLGISAKLIWQLYGTGTHGIGVFLSAIGALESGICDVVMVVYASSTSTAGTGVGRDVPKQSMEGAYGVFGPAALAAGWARKYMSLYGTNEHHLGEVAVTLRDYANKRPEAIMFDKKLTMEDYLNSRYIAEPLRARDCCLVNDGAAALIITTAEKARNLRRQPVYIMGYGQDYSAGEAAHSPESVYQFDGAITRKVSRDALGMAGIELKDIDVAQFYDAFTINIIDQLSGYGFCKRGEEGAFIEEGNMRLGGALPCNTSGTELSWGYLHVWTHFIEAIRQLRSEAGECQVKNAEICLVTGGLSAIGSGLSSACFILRR
jgi:acetyl-CoA acetyltransferase